MYLASNIEHIHLFNRPLFLAANYNMTKPIVVQGTAVSDPYANHPDSGFASEFQGSHNQPHHSPSGAVKGEIQETKCRDPLFAVLLYINVGAIAAVAFAYGVPAYQNTDTVGFYSGYMYAAAIAAAFSLLFSGLALGVMMAIPSLLIKTSLIFSVIITGLWAVLAFISGQIFFGIIGLVFFALSLCYARAVWPRIPFATANLITATTAVRNNLGIAIIAYFFTALAVGWSLLWTLALVGLWDKTNNCTTNANEIQTCSGANYGILFALFVAYFFTHQVLQNTVHVVTAGIVGTLG